VYALLYKDWLLLRKEKSLWFILPLILVGGAASGLQPLSALFIGLFPLFFIGSVLGTFDYRYKAEASLISLPVTKASIVLANYAAGIAATGTVALLATILGLVRLALGPEGQAFPWGFPLASLALGLTFISLNNASYFRFGYLKSRWVSILLFVIPSAGYGALWGLSGASMAAISPGSRGPLDPAIMLRLLGKLPAIAALFAASLLVCGLSILYSIRAFSRREF
jgi:hypothetical protein